MRPHPLSAACFIFIAAPLSHAFAAPHQTVDPATVHRALHLYNVAICLDAPTLIVTDLEQISQALPNGEKQKGPPPADAETIELLMVHANLLKSTYLRVRALFLVGAMGGEAEKFAKAAAELCFASARLAWAQGRAAETLSWIEQAVDQCEKASEAGRVSFDTNWLPLDHWINTRKALTTSTFKAYSIRQSCEALGYDLSDLGKQPRLNDGTYEPKWEGPDAQWLERPQIFSSARQPNERPIVLSSAVGSIDARALRHYLRVAQISVCPNMSSVIPSEVDRLVDFNGSTSKPSAPTVLESETRQILNDRLLRAMGSYRHVKRLVETSAPGGTTVDHSMAAQRMCQAHATVSWAQGNLDTTLGWLQRAISWGNLRRDAAQGAFDQNLINLDSHLAAQDADIRTKLAALCARRFFEVRDIPHKIDRSGQPPADIHDPSPLAEGRTATETATLQTLLHLSNVATCLNLPPLVGLQNQASTMTSARHGPSPADTRTIEVALIDSDSAVSAYRRVRALHQVGAQGGEPVKHAKTAAEVCLSRARLECVTGHNGPTVAWLNLAVHWSRIAMEFAEADYRSNPAAFNGISFDGISLESYITAQDTHTQAKLASRYVRQSFAALKYEMSIKEIPPLQLDGDQRETYDAYAESIRAEYGLPTPSFFRP